MQHKALEMAQFEAKHSAVEKKSNGHTLTLKFERYQNENDADKYRQIYESKEPALVLKDCDFTTESIATIMKTVNGNPNIQCLAFENCDFLDTRAKSFGSTLISLVTEHFNDCGRIFGELLQENRHLTRLSVEAKESNDEETSTELSLDCIKKIAAALKKPHSKLTALRVIFHEQSDYDDRLRILLNGADGNATLKILTVNGARLSTKGSEVLYRVLAQNTLQRLNLPNLRIRDFSTDGDFDHYDQMVKNLCNGLLRATHLNHLNLSRLIVNFCYQRGNKTKRIELVSGKGPVGIHRYVEMLLQTFKKSHHLTSIILTNAHHEEATEIAYRIACQNRAKNQMEAMLLGQTKGAGKNSSVQHYRTNSQYSRNPLSIIYRLLDDSEEPGILQETKAKPAAAPATGFAAVATVDNATDHTVYSTLSLNNGPGARG